MSITFYCKLNVVCLSWVRYPSDQEVAKNQCHDYWKQPKVGFVFENKQVGGRKFEGTQTQKDIYVKKCNESEYHSATN